MPRDPAALHKMKVAREHMMKAEELLQSVTSSELLEAGYTDEANDAANMGYRVFAHATAIRIVREHLSTEFLG